MIRTHDLTSVVRTFATRVLLKALGKRDDVFLYAACHAVAIVLVTVLVEPLLTTLGTEARTLVLACLVLYMLYRIVGDHRGR